MTYEGTFVDNGEKFRTWCFRASNFTVSRLDASRSSDALKAILTETLGGVFEFFYHALNTHFRRETTPALLR
jgi:hypothetical protein